MHYRIEIKPGKEQAFLQLLQSWQTLGVVTRFERMDEEDTPPPTNEQHAVDKLHPSPAEQALQYRDLVD